MTSGRHNRQEELLIQLFMGVIGKKKKSTIVSDFENKVLATFNCLSSMGPGVVKPNDSHNSKLINIPTCTIYLMFAKCFSHVKKHTIDYTTL